MKFCLLNCLWKEIPRIILQLVFCGYDQDHWKMFYVKEFIASPTANNLQYF